MKYFYFVIGLAVPCMRSINALALPSSENKNGEDVSVVTTSFPIKSKIVVESKEINEPEKVIDSEKVKGSEEPNETKLGESKETLDSPLNDIQSAVDKVGVTLNHAIKSMSDNADYKLALQFRDFDLDFTIKVPGQSIPVAPVTVYPKPVTVTPASLPKEYMSYVDDQIALTLPKTTILITPPPFDVTRGSSFGIFTVFSDYFEVDRVTPPPLQITVPATTVMLPKNVNQNEQIEIAYSPITVIPPDVYLEPKQINTKMSQLIKNWFQKATLTQFVEKIAQFSFYAKAFTRFYPLLFTYLLLKNTNPASLVGDDKKSMNIIKVHETLKKVVTYIFFAAMFLFMPSATLLVGLLKLVHSGVFGKIERHTLPDVILSAAFFFTYYMLRSKLFFFVKK